MAKTSKKQVARQAVAAMCRPEGVSVTKWCHLQVYLVAVAEHYPKAYPSQITLAKETGFNVRSIRRYQAMAVELGLLLVKPDAGVASPRNGLSKTNQYLILTPPKLSSPLRTESPPNPTGTSYPAGELRSSHSLSENHSGEPALPVHISRMPEEPSRQVGQEPEPPRLSKSPRPRPKAGELVTAGEYQRRYSVKPPKPGPAWKQAAEHFVRQWQEMVTNTTMRDSLRSMRVVETIGHCQRYLNAHFFGAGATNPKSLPEVCDLMDEFIDSAYRGRLKIKDGQSAWMAFTGAWGRKRVDTDATKQSNAAYVPPTYGAHDDDDQPR